MNPAVSPPKEKPMRSERIRGWMALLLVAVLAGCASGKHQAPVEDRTAAAVGTREQVVLAAERHSPQ